MKTIKKPGGFPNRYCMYQKVFKCIFVSIFQISYSYQMLAISEKCVINTCMIAKLESTKLALSVLLNELEKLKCKSLSKVSCYTLESWNMIYHMGAHDQFTALLNACILKSIRLHWTGRYAPGKTFDSKRTAAVWWGTRSDIGTYRRRFCHVHTWWSKFAKIHVYFIRSKNIWQWINFRINWLDTDSNHKH